MDSVQSLVSRSSRLAELDVKPVPCSGHCYQPIRLVNKRYDTRTFQGSLNFRSYLSKHGHVPCDYRIYVPCGKCQGCFLDRARDWRIRLFYEQRFGEHNDCIAVTLTFDEQSMSKINSLDDVKHAFRSFLDRLRYYSNDRKLPKRWFITELGENTGRLHFHGFVWDCAFTYHDFRLAWRNGFVWIDKVRSDKQFTYATKYMTKVTLKYPWFKPQVFVSPGLGRGYVTKSSINIHHNFSKDVSRFNFLCDFNNVKYRMPAYYKRKIFTDSELRSYKDYMATSDRPTEKFFAGRRYASIESYLKARDEICKTSVAFGRSKALKDNVFRSVLDDVLFTNNF